MSDDLPADVTTEAVLELYADVLEQHRSGGSSNDIVCLLDDWFVAQGFPTVIYAEEAK
ncbi:hypothetical protein [Paractinoplanes toevensis]|uniref:Uncharacterized protein n=1 Tax=Paractinoplanes toevensis TaxID=571911 RepID=A0A919W1T1_9ACTN|nr:hypothetical protein [Actinoplanes toevensis]GIM88775.1 hypothetical protein Ato02nite_005680 [Actinoplanes toevensis]